MVDTKQACVYTHVVLRVYVSAAVVSLLAAKHVAGKEEENYL